ncbi:hypothetical protein ACIHEI_00785 [Kitasatospora sp. NPDC051984]|uniref:hypothetical protein n=1 Tax=Kitasatospora sp. NPDC051984 TaxID=3364059 RepID=UPI0037CB43FE
MPAATSKLARVALATAIAVSGSVAATAVTLATATTARAASAVDGPVTRGEIIQRAQYWYGKSIPYNQGGDGRGGWATRAKIATGTTTDQNTVHFADVTGDGHADYLVVNGPTTAFAYNGGDDAGGWINLGQIATGV